MQYVRMVAWVAALFGVLVFCWANWDQRVSVTIWENLVVETNAPALMLLSFALGFLPLWFLHRASRWRLNRRVHSLERAIRNAAGVPPAPAAGPAEGDEDTAAR